MAFMWGHRQAYIESIDETYFIGAEILVKDRKEKYHLQGFGTVKHLQF
jgi:hypothetical protein